jgi:hypothetical protein
MKKPPKVILPDSRELARIMHESFLKQIEVKKAQLSGCLSYNPIPDPLKGKGHMGRVIQRLKQEIADLEEEDRKLILQAEQRRLLLNSTEENLSVRSEWLISTDYSSPQLLPPARRTVNRRNRPVDSKKELIAQLKARNPDAKARRICELIDSKIERTSPALRPRFEPLGSWLATSGAPRTWLGLYDYEPTHNLVRAYVNKVPRMKTSK